MGDTRYDAAYESVLTSRDRAATIQALSDREIIYALAAASKRMDAYLANVLASAALDRQSRRDARFLGVVAGALVVIVLRTLLITYEAIRPDSPLSRLLWLTSTLSLLIGLCTGGLVYRWRRRVR